jgi:hypothetical protein
MLAVKVNIFSKISLTKTCYLFAKKHIYESILFRSESVVQIGNLFPIFQFAFDLIKMCIVEAA